jgi:menaquinol-cytochrome c reductase iron-sulfur subunit
VKNPFDPSATAVDPESGRPPAGNLPCHGDVMAQANGAKTDAGRRTFLQWVTYALGAAAVALVGSSFSGYLIGTGRRKTDWVDLGPLSKFPINETRVVDFDNPLRTAWDGITARTGVFVRYEGKDENLGEQFLVLSVNCAHLGCPVSWFPQSGLFMCPCHGGVYYSNGERASGPPPRGLFACVWRVRGGRLEIQAPHYPTLQNTLTKPG